MDFDSLEIEDEGFTYTTNFKQTGKRKQRQSERASSPEYREAGLDETSAPEEMDSRRTKRQSRMQTGSSIGREAHASEDENTDSTSPTFWHASVNAVEAYDLSEPTTYQEAISGPDQLHWRKAIRAELDSMRLRQVFRAAKLPSGLQAIGTKWVFRIKQKADGSI